jgi:hypothetical protein
MEFLQILKLSDINIHNPWTNAPKGTILQMISGDGVVIGMRTTYGEPDALIILAGKHAGELITDANLTGPALDLGELGEQVEIVACDPAPRLSATVEAGFLCRHRTSPNVYFVWGKFAGRSAGGVCVASDDPKSPVGECYPNLGQTTVIAIGRVDLRLRESS